MTLTVILHNIRSAHNVGSIFRTADGAGISKIFLTGYTPAPKDRFGRMNSEIAKTSLGAAELIPYESREDIRALIAELTQAGVQIIAVEQTKKAIDYRTFTPKENAAFLFGNEITGIEEEVLRDASTHIKIPMSGAKESLNVSVAAGIILFHYRTM